MASIERRLSALGEIGRILKRGGKAMVTSWATDQSGNGGSNYVKKTVEDHNGPKSTPLPIHKGTIEYFQIPRSRFQVFSRLESRLPPSDFGLIMICL